MGSSLEHVKHIVVLMMENRSFDNMLGVYRGLSNALYNETPDGRKINVWWGDPNDTDDDLTMTIPDPDPGELWVDMNYQLFEEYFPAEGATPNMMGFVKNYVHQSIATRKHYDPRAIMHCFRPDQVSVTTTLAKNFGISDAWFASAPCQTWPNRFFVHTATADGYVDNLPDLAWKVAERLPYDMPTVFNQFEEPFPELDKGWRIYWGDFPASALLSRLWDHVDHFHPMEQFKEDVRRNDLQPYSFIEPRYFPDPLTGSLPNDQHPPHNVTLGEQLIGEVYNTLRANEEIWKETLLVVIWDEHGGCYDHVGPGSATPPGGKPRPPQNFPFDRYGVRVPCLLVSPFIEAGSIHRSQEHHPFDHTTVIKTVRECFGLAGGPLTPRDEHAPSLAPVLTLGPENLNMGPESIPLPLYIPGSQTVDAAARAPLTDFQRGLLEVATLLPVGEGCLAWPAALSRRSLDAGDEVRRSNSAGEASTYVQERWGKFKGRRAKR